MGTEPPTLAAALPEGDATTREVVGAVPDLYRYAVRLTGGDRALAEDLVQETCLAAVRQVRSEPGAQLGVGWLVVVLRRRYLDHVRKDRRETARMLRVGAAEASVSEPDWSAVGGGEALAALGLLSARQRIALVLRYVDDLSVQDVADLLELSVAATESLLARGRRELAQRLGGAGRG